MSRQETPKRTRSRAVSSDRGDNQQLISKKIRTNITGGGVFSSKSALTFSYSHSTPIQVNSVQTQRPKTSISARPFNFEEEISPIVNTIETVPQGKRTRERIDFRSVFFEPFSYDRLSYYQEIWANMDYSSLRTYKRDQIPYMSQQFETNYKATFAYEENLLSQRQFNEISCSLTEVTYLLDKIASLIFKCNTAH